MFEQPNYICCMDIMARNIVNTNLDYFTTVDSRTRVYSLSYVVPSTSLLYTPVPSCVTAATLTLYLVPNCRPEIVVEVELPDTVRGLE